MNYLKKKHKNKCPPDALNTKLTSPYSLIKQDSNVSLVKQAV